MTVADFWNAEGVKAEYGAFVREVGPSQGALMFWQMQETKDRYQWYVRGKVVTATELERRHELALEMAGMTMEELDFAINYERAVWSGDYAWDPDGTFQFQHSKRG